ncbi:MAG: macrocin O-methyltransferase, partial [Catenulispora sp. 13_1_20CM_3_70_7]
RRASGRDWPVYGETMIGLHRLDNLHQCIRDVLQRQVPGDLIETGVWRGGATIFMRASLEAYGDTARRVWVADSFAGLPRPDPAYAADTANTLWNDPRLAASLDQVKANFARYGLLDERVRFLVGWFRDTLPKAPIEQLSILRLDGDLYESTMDALRCLYPKLSIGGYIIVDDYGVEGLGCRRAVDEFRAERDIRDPIEVIDWAGAFWQRSH